MIYTSYYAGQKRGAEISISLSPPGEWKGQHMPLFAPTPEILDKWENSKQDLSAEDEYTVAFSAHLDKNWQLIDLWLKKQSISKDVTLLCYEANNEFCHRHLVGDRIKSLRPSLWGGEVSEIKEVKPLTEHLSWSELLGVSSGTVGLGSDKLPTGWATVESVNAELIGQEVKYRLLRSRCWVSAKFIDYSEKGKFGEVDYNGKICNVFLPEHLAVKNDG